MRLCAKLLDAVEVLEVCVRVDAEAAPQYCSDASPEIFWERPSDRPRDEVLVSEDHAAPLQKIRHVLVRGHRMGRRIPLVGPEVHDFRAGPHFGAVLVRADDVQEIGKSLDLLKDTDRLRRDPWLWADARRKLHRLDDLAGLKRSVREVQETLHACAHGRSTICRPAAPRHGGGPIRDWTFPARPCGSISRRHRALIARWRKRLHELATGCDC
mmetsp:Transcript_105648/g.297177  ORF Transcript_105648/g.297177 Transcript_105648/m.297177 type:complete len:213 (+) Transcript_105648:413-1051(+)